MKAYIHNLALIEDNEPRLSISNIAFSYGYGAYENIRVTNGEVRYLNEHLDRLQSSLKLLSIPLPYRLDQIDESIKALAAKLGDTTYNLKIIVVGGDDPQLFVLPLTPKFIDRKAYRDGVTTITVNYERFMPQVKSLNMLGSYMVYKQAQAANAYDALLIDHEGYILEGSRTNFYGFRDKTIVTAPDEVVLAGVTRKHILQFAKAQGFDISFEKINKSQLGEFDSFAVSNTSSKLLPVTSINENNYEISQQLLELVSSFKKEY